MPDRSRSTRPAFSLLTALAVLAPLAALTPGPAQAAPLATPATPAAPAASGGDVLANPTFDTGLRGWQLTSPVGRLGTISDGLQGRAARLSHTAASATSVGLRTSIPRTSAGTSYTVTAWARASRPTTVNLRLSESGRGSAGQVVGSALVGTSWQQLGISTVAARTGSSLTLEVTGARIARGARVDLDSFELARRTLVFRDEFTGSSLNRSAWTPLHHGQVGSGNGEQSCYMDRAANVRVTAGTLQLIGRRESGLTCGANDSAFPNGRPFSSGFLNTQGKRTFTYGRFEMRAKFPTQRVGSQGMWTAFWLWPEQPGPGELDVVEAIGTSAARPDEYRRVHQFIHYDAAETYQQQGQASYFPKGTPSDGFHTYALEWEPTTLRWFVDGRLTYTRNRTTTPWLASTFNRPMHLMLNLTVGATWPGTPTAATRFPGVFSIDYVRVYSRSR